MRSAEETALLVALLFKRSGQKRARLSTAELRRLARRRKIRTPFLTSCANHLDDFGLVLIEIDRGGYGLLPVGALDGAPVLTADRQFRDLSEGEGMSFDAIRTELEADPKSYALPEE